MAEKITKRNHLERKREERFRRFQKYNNAFIKLSKLGILYHDDIESALKKITEIAAETLDVGRVNIWMYNDDKSKIICVENYELEEKRHSKGLELISADYPNYFAVLNRERFIAVADTYEDARTMEFFESYLSKYDISSLLDAPIVLGGEIAGVICHENVGEPRLWNEEDQSFVVSIADLVSLVITFDERSKTVEALRKSEIRFKNLFENSPNALFVEDLEGNILDVNKAACKLQGYKRKDLIGKNVTELVPEDERENMKKDYSKVVAGELMHFDGKSLREDGSTVPIEGVVDKIEIGGVPAVLLTVIDISKRKEAELNVQARTSQQAGIAELSQFALEQPDLKLLWDRACEIISETLEVEYSKVLEFQPDGKNLLLKAGIGWKKGLVGKALVGTAKMSQAGYTLLSNKPVIVNDLRKETRFSGPALLIDHNVVSGISVILGCPADVFGVLGAHTQERRKFSKDDINFMQSVANIITTAVESNKTSRLIEESEKKYLDLYENAPVMYHSLDPNGVIIDCNRTELRTLGYKKEEMVGQKIFNFQTDKSAKKGQKAMRQLRQGEDIKDIELQFKYKNGKVLDVLLSASAVRDEKGSFIYSRSVMRDISEHKQMEENLKQTLSIHRSTLESTTDGILVVDNSGKIVSFNQQFVEMWKIPKNIIKLRDDKKAIEFVLDQLKAPDEFLKKIKDLYDQPEEVSFDILSFKDGKTFERYSIPQEIGGKIIGRVWSFRDITARMKAERDLRFTRFTIDHASEAVYWVSNDARITDMNETCTHMLGYSRDELLNMTIFDISPGISKEDWPSGWEKLKALKTITLETEHRAKDGRMVPVEITGNYLVFEGVEYNCAFVKDITGRKSAERVLQASEGRYHTLFNDSRDAVFITARDGWFIDVNQSGLELFGYTLEDMLHVNAQELYVNTADRKKFKEEIEKTGSVEDYEVQLRKKDGTIMDCIITSTVRLHDDGTILGYQGIIRDITVRKRMEEKVQKLSSAVEQTGGMIFITNKEGVIEYANPAFEKVTGYSSEYLIGRKPSILKSGKHLQKIYTNLWDTILSGEDFHGMLINKKKNGEIYYEEKIISPLKDAEGNMTHFVSTGWDITKRKLAEDKVRLLQLLSEIINKADNVHDAFMGIIKEVCDVTIWAVGEAWVPNSDRTFLELGAWFSNDAGLEPFKKVAEKTTFVPGEGLPGKAWASKKSESLADVSKDLYFLRQNVARDVGLKTGVSIPVFADNEVIVVLTFFLTEVSKVDEDFIDLITAVAYQLGSIIQRKLAEDDLKVSEGKFRSVFEDSKDAIYINNRDGQFIEVNQAMLDLLGYTREKLMKIKADELYVNRGDRKRAQQEIDDDGNIKDFEVKWRRKDGTEIDIILTSTGRRGDDGSIVGYQGVILDITKRKQAEEELKKKHRELKLANEEIKIAFEHETKLRDKLIKAQKLATLGEIAAKIAHEINNPLTVIMGHTQMELMSDHPEKLTASLTQINKKALQIKNLTRGYMDLGKSEDSAITEIVLGEVMRSTISSLEPLGQLKHVELIEEYTENEPKILGDSSKLEQVFRNLILNAVDATSDTIKRVITVGTIISKEEEGVEAFVSDTGVGIKPEIIDKIFEDFYTTKGKGIGTGLGLAITKEIVESGHAGKLLVESTPGKGTTFKVLLPLIDLVLKKKKLLIVDDEAYVLQTFADYLRGMGFNVKTARNGKEALGIYSHLKPDLIISDVKMPIMDGFELLDTVKESNPDQRFIMITGYFSKEGGIEMLKQKKIPYLKKPISLEDELLKAIKEQLKIK